MEAAITESGGQNRNPRRERRRRGRRSKPRRAEHKTEELLGTQTRQAEAPASEPAGTTDEEDIGNVGNVAIVEDLVAAKASRTRQIADERGPQSAKEGRRGEGGDGGRRHIGERGGRFESSNDDLDNDEIDGPHRDRPEAEQLAPLPPHREGPRHHRGA